MRIDILIPNYNGTDLIKKNLEKVIKAIEREKGGIIIIDDGSTFQEREKLREFIKDVSDKAPTTNIDLLETGKNLGFSSAINKGAAHSKAELIVLLNTDVVPEEDFLDPIIEDFTKDKDLFGVGCMDKSIEDGDTVLRGRGIGTWEKGFISHRRGEVDHKDTFWVSGGSSVLRREDFLKLGGFDEIYDPFYWEDIDLSYRAQKAGYNILFENKSVVEHRHSEGSIKKHYGDFRIKRIAYRNQFIFVWKNISDFNLFLSYLFWLPYHCLFALLRFDIAFFFGFLSAIIKIPVIIQKRIKQGKSYKRLDREIIFSR
ncbi:MAG: glycosyltransferase [bacterium]|nr:glycosyltransferase [bacterium]